MPFVHHHKLDGLVLANRPDRLSHPVAVAVARNDHGHARRHDEIIASPVVRLQTHAPVTFIASHGQRGGQVGYLTSLVRAMDPGSVPRTARLDSPWFPRNSGLRTEGG